MVSALDSGASGPGSSPGRGQCIVFLGLQLFTHRWVSAAICWGNLTTLRGSDLRWTSIRSGEVEILLAASCYRNRDKPAFRFQGFTLFPATLVISNVRTGSLDIKIKTEIGN